jgi:ATP-dependent Clp protease ATP-binding subunit ClpA/ActR/RegA family two-component response regulator
VEGADSKDSNELVALLAKKVVGQPAALKFIVPFVEMHQAGLAPEGRPVGVFLLLGPTGTGKTRTVEVLAEVLHGSEKQFIRIDCGEFQMEHEVAKLIGAPPGYLGHRETQPIITQKRLSEVASEKSDLALVLFDEIEKAAPSLTRLLLGILDKATLRLGDNSSVNFEKTLIFLTSNLGAREMMKEMNPQFGFQGSGARDRAELTNKLESIALAAVRKKFSPEFVNRIDAVVTYQPLDEESLGAILEHHITELQQHVNTRLGPRCFSIEVTPDSKQFLLKRGTSPDYGARELKRTVHRHLTQPLATLVASGQIEAGARVRVDTSAGGDKLLIQTVGQDETRASQHPTVLIVDDNRDLLRFLEHLMEDADWSILAAESAAQTHEMLARRSPNVALLDYMLPDGNGVELAVQIRGKYPNTQMIIMTGAQLPVEEEAICESYGFPVLRKPFLASDVMSAIRARLSLNSVASGQ